MISTHMTSRGHTLMKIMIMVGMILVVAIMVDDNPEVIMVN